MKNFAFNLDKTHGVRKSQIAAFAYIECDNSNRQPAVGIILECGKQCTIPVLDEIEAREIIEDLING